MPKKITRRPKGEGSIITLPNGKLKMTITLGVGVDGKQKRKAVTAATKGELIKKAAEVRVLAGLKPVGNKDKYVKDVVEEFKLIKEHEVTEDSFKNIESADKKVFVPLYDLKISKVTPEMLDNIFMGLKVSKNNGRMVDAAPSYKKSLKSITSDLFNYAVDKEYIDKNPMRKTRKIVSDRMKADLVIPMEKQMQDILSNAKTYDTKTDRPHYMTLYPLFLLAVATGMRIGELLDLDRSQLEGTQINVKSQLKAGGSGMPLKTKSSYRIIYVNPSVMKEVLKYAPASDKTTKLFVDALGRPLRYVRALNCISRYLKSANVPEGFTMHSFRHYHATLLLTKGVSVKDVSKRLGHKSVKVTLDTYTHWIPEQDESAAMMVSNDYIV